MNDTTNPRPHERDDREGHAVSDTEIGRPIVVVDCESTGLRGIDIAVEVAWIDLATDDRGSFVPQHDVQWVLDEAEPRALEVNGYRERLIKAAQDDGGRARELYDVLDGAVLAGSNPTADAAWLEKLFARHCGELATGDRIAPFRPWHHRMLDLSAYAAGVLSLPPGQLPGLWDLCNLLGVTPEPDVHSAAEGAAVTARCFYALFVKAGVRA